MQESPNKNFEIQELKHQDLAALKKFTDEQIGAGYYSTAELEDIFQRSQLRGKMTSFLLKKNNEIVGLRFTFPPGQWSHGKGNGLSLEKWPHPLKQTAYFQSLFLAPAAQGAGWGAKLSGQSIEVLKELGALGVVCHSWKESPHNSSARYLEKMGFKVIVEHPLYWQHINYNCTRCLKPPCQCTALEMYLDLGDI